MRPYLVAAALCAPASPAAAAGAAEPGTVTITQGVELSTLHPFTKALR